LKIFFTENEQVKIPEISEILYEALNKWHKKRILKYKVHRILYKCNKPFNFIASLTNKELTYLSIEFFSALAAAF